MPMPARTLKTSLRFMLEALHTRDQSPCDLPGNSARGPDTPVGDASYCRKGRDCAPTTGARVAGVANGIVVQVVHAGERQATRWAHLYLRYRVRSGNMIRASCYRARRRLPGS